MKITVKDSDKDFHIFTGPDLRYYQDGNTCEVVSFTGDKRIALGYFTSIKWVKVVENDVAAPVEAEAPEESVDKFTQRDIEVRDPLEKVDFNILKDETPIPGVEEQKRGNKKKPATS